jgi:hypothetical protein
MGIRHVSFLDNCGALAPDLVERSLARFAREVIPAVGRRLGVRTAA